MKLSLVNEWGLVISSVNGTRPGTSQGASVTPTQNTTGGAYATLLASGSVTEDVYAIDICVNSIGTSGAARDALATLAIDPAGGTSFTDVADLLCGQAASVASGGAGGVWFHFPLWLKAGTTIGMRGSVNSATLTAFQAYVRVYCKPSRPELIWCGQKIEQLGVTAGTSTGTSVTPGTVSEGAWTSIGTLTRSHRFFEFGFGCNDAALNNNGYNVDVSIGDASNKKIIALDRLVSTANTENVTKLASPIWANASASDIAYVRMQCGPNAVGTVSATVYAMGD